MRWRGRSAVVTRTKTSVGQSGRQPSAIIRSMRPGLVLSTFALMTVTACGSSAAPAAAPTTSRPSKTPSATPTSLSTATWVDYSWPAAGFAVRLPARPQQKTQVQTAGSIVVTMRLATAKRVAHQGVLVGDAHFDHSVPSAAMATELRSSVYGFAGASGATIESGGATTFRGLPAYEATLGAPNGLSFAIIGVLKDSNNEILVLAPKGAIFNVVTRSLRFL